MMITLVKVITDSISLRLRQLVPINYVVVDDNFGEIYPNLSFVYEELFLEGLIMYVPASLSGCK